MDEGEREAQTFTPRSITTILPITVNRGRISRHLPKEIADRTAAAAEKQILVAMLLLS